MSVHLHRQGPRVAATSGPAWTSTLARTSWVALLAISSLGALNHLLGVVTFATDGEEQLMFAMFAIVNAYGTAVLLFPYRRHLRWAWLVTWLEVAAFASVFPLIDGGIGVGYLVVAAIAGLAQLATAPEFWPQPTRQRQEESLPERTSWQSRPDSRAPQPARSSSDPSDHPGVRS